MTFSFRRAARIIPLVALGTLAVSPVSIAAENDAEARYTKLDITGTGTIQAPPDQLTARFRAESRDTSAAAAQQSVNTQVHKATDLAEKAKGVTYAVLHYSVSELRGEKDKTPPSWSASQTMTFTATDGKSLLPLTGQLQANGLLLEGLEWSLSPDKQKTLFLEAEKAAVTDAKKQAETLAATLGLKVVRFSTISVSGSSFPRPVFMAAMAARSMDSVTPPSSTAETQNVNATANTTVLLAP